MTAYKPVFLAFECMNDSNETEDLPTCSCGYDRNHPIVVPKNEYTIGGWILLLTGINAHPQRKRFYCPECQETFDATTDPEILRRYID